MTIRSDRGTQFVNGIIKELLSLLQVEHEVSLAYSKEHNAIVERANREVMRHLTAIIFDKRVSEAWSSDYLPLVQRIMNAKVHDTIGVSPAELLFGQAINLYSGLLSAIPPESLIKGLDDSASGRLSEHVAKLTKAQHTLIEVARNNQLASDSHHMKEAIPFSHVFPVNSYVLYRPPDNSRHKMPARTLS
jgi:transposase InsO family protein